MTKDQRHRKHQLTTEDRIRGIRAALASPRTPHHLRPSLERQLEELQRGTGRKHPVAKRNRSESKAVRKRLFDFLPF